MLLADMGAEVVTVDRVSPHGLGIAKEPRFNPIMRNRKSVAIDLKKAEGRDAALRMIATADALIEGNRPGVMERLGLSPEACWAANPTLVYGRMTGWGQDGPMAQAVGHDLNYLAVSGALSLIGPADGPPSIPLNFLADFGGGGVYLALGLLAAILDARGSGRGQVVDAAMVDGLGSLLTNQFGYLASGRWEDRRASNFTDGGAPWYNVYETADGRYVSIAAVEPKFYAELLEAMGLDPDGIPDQFDRQGWPALRLRFAEIFRCRTRDQWAEIMEGRSACFAPVLSLVEAPVHPQLAARDAFVEVDGVLQPAPAPRFSRTPASIGRGPPTPGEHTDEVLTGWGFENGELDGLRAAGAIA
jgi:alpha-methylacyl-CoA racemase